MKTFESEYKELVEWWAKEDDKIDAMNIPWEGGLDGGDTYMRRELGSLYRKKLRELKKKYNME